MPEAAPICGEGPPDFSQGPSQKHPWVWLWTERMEGSGGWRGEGEGWNVLEQEFHKGAGQALPMFMQTWMPPPGAGRFPAREVSEFRGPSRPTSFGG